MSEYAAKTEAVSLDESAMVEGKRVNSPVTASRVFKEFFSLCLFQSLELCLEVVEYK